MPDPSFRQKYEWARQHTKSEPQRPEQASVVDDPALQKQLLTGAAMLGGGAYSAALGLGASSSGAGAVIGVPMALTGGSDAVQGTTMVWDALHGRHSEGYNPGKEASRYVADQFLGADPDWGSFAYDVGDLGAGLLSFRRLVPMAVDPAVTGINRTKSLFGVKVPAWDNSRTVGGKVYDSLINRPLLGLSLLPKVYHAYQDYPRSGQGAEE